MGQFYRPSFLAGRPTAQPFSLRRDLMSASSGGLLFMWLQTFSAMWEISSGEHAGPTSCVLYPGRCFNILV